MQVINIGGIKGNNLLATRSSCLVNNLLATRSSCLVNNLLATRSSCLVNNLLATRSSCLVALVSCVGMNVRPVGL